MKKLRENDISLDKLENYLRNVYLAVKHNSNTLPIKEEKHDDAKPKLIFQVNRVENKVDT